jgi:hypothetical protein
MGHSSNINLGIYECELLSATSDVYDCGSFTLNKSLDVDGYGPIAETLV